MILSSGIESNITNVTWSEIVKCNQTGDMVYKVGLKVADGKILNSSPKDPKGITLDYMYCKIENFRLQGETYMKFHKIRNGFGDFTEKYGKCKGDGYIVGFRLQICGPRVGAADAYVYCSENRDAHQTLSNKVWVDEHCKWGPPRYCPPNYGVCGRSFEYITENEDVDNRGYTNLKLICCPVPNAL